MDKRLFLKIDRLSKTFGNFVALKDIELGIMEGEFICFLGPSGCGKTTLLRAIAGLDIQTSGRITQQDREISGLPPAARDFGIVFQSYALFPNLTVWANVAYGLHNRGQKRQEVAARVDELLALVGLTGSETKYPAQLSGGQQQRVALARALAPRPSLLLLDEPLSALDANVRVYLRREIRALQRRLRVTTIMVTHDQEEALTMADRIVVMNHGSIEQVAAPLEIYRRPASPFVADFVGSMNFLKGKVIGAREVRIGTLVIVMDGMEGLREGEEVIVCVRPEDITVRNVNDTTPNNLSAHISDIEFLGSFYRAQLAAPALAQHALIANFSINAMQDLSLMPGQKLTVALPAHRMRLFIAAGSAP